MTARYVQRGDSIDYILDHDVAAGDVINHCGLIGGRRREMTKNRGFSEKRKRPIEMRREKVYENMSKIQDGWRGQHCAGPRFNHKENYNG